MDLGEQGSAGGEVCSCKAGKGIVEEEGIVVRDEECEMGFGLQDVGGHGGFVAIGDIGGIADDTRKLGEEGPLQRVEEIELVEADGGL